MLISTTKHHAAINRLKAQNMALLEALKAANIENEQLTDKLQKLTVELLVKEAENERQLKQLDLLRGVGDV